MDSVYKQEFRVRDLPTRSVTLFPTRAQVVRDLKDVTLTPGVNQITVVGFTPTIDESSIKVEGTGSAIISDIVVEELPNREIFEEVYPEMDEEGDEEEEDSSSDDDGELKEEPALKEARRRLDRLREDEKRACEVVSSAESQLQFLDAYGKMLDRKKGVEIDVGIEKYRAGRAKTFQDHMDGRMRLQALKEPIELLEKEIERLERQHARAQAKADRAHDRVRKARAKEREKKRRRKAEALQEKARQRKELQKFWPRKCYSVRILLDVSSFTPSTSRRTSVVSFTEVAAADAVVDSGGGGGGGEEEAPTCDLAISYVTLSAFWSPSYDLQLSTTSNTGLLCFDAKLTNTTSESWQGCKVILSTSQTTYAGLGDTIPALLPWRVKLAKGQGLDGILNSREELRYKSGGAAHSQAQTAAQVERSRVLLFGTSDGLSSARFVKTADRRKNQKMQALQQASQQAALQTAQRQVQQQMQRQLLQQQSRFGRGFSTAEMGTENCETASRSPAAVAIGAMSSRAPPAAPAAPALRVAAPLRFRKAVGVASSEDEGMNYALFDGDDATMGAEQEISFQESAFEETGLTTTYDLPGLKTLTPSATASKQRVSRISFQGVAFSHTIVAKYKPAAYLKAKLKNMSKITLLKGTAGLTLDGSFMGRTVLPHCSAGDAFTLSLGVDPAIRVAYPKPDVKRATTGLFSKEDSSAFQRSVMVTNTRASAGKPVTLLVLDQVPVSEDEKLRVDIQQPRGLVVGGAGVATGTGLISAGPGGGAVPAASKDWGTATAHLKTAGEITWNVQLNAGRAVKLPLEYDVSVPSGEGVLQC